MRILHGDLVRKNLTTTKKHELIFKMSFVWMRKDSFLEVYHNCLLDVSFSYGFERLVCWIIVDIVVSILDGIELDNEYMT
jgi:hypothetical protein